MLFGFRKLQVALTDFNGREEMSRRKNLDLLPPILKTLQLLLEPPEQKVIEILRGSAKERKKQVNGSNTSALM